MNSWKRKLFLASAIGAGVGLLAVLALAAGVGYMVYFGDVSDLKKSTILARINEETTLYTLDEEHKIGSFFNEEHRSYITIDQIPEDMIRAMVAAEDKNFFQHYGVDPMAIFQAFSEGVMNGMKFRRGGSSITQQTVKNVMDHREHSFQRKFKELVRAFQIERMYSKKQILEFYLNQFHVTANGKGIGIAARYYFNKDVKDLSLIESAFIAGSVKGPSKYNPFVKYNRKDKETAWNEANIRKNYVLRRMYEQGWIKEEQFKKGFEERVPFNQGKFGTSEVALVSLIRAQLDKREILDALGMQTIDELSHAGLKVFTTIDKRLQEEAQLAMRRNLSRLEMILRDFSPESPSSYHYLRSLIPNQFYYGKVTRIEKGKNPQLSIDFGLPKAIIPTEALIRTAKILSIPTYKPYEFHLKDILEKLKVGDIVFTEVVEYNEETHEAVVELKKKPTVNGGLISLDEGEVRSVVSGFDSEGFNRAVFATRQPGSVFKSVVFFGAMQMGWTILDKLANERRLFNFQGKFYFPRGDHASPYDDVSMLWAGTKSENLATVFLTANLLDKLNYDEFKELMGTLDLLPHEGEAPRDYHFRVAKATGVQLDNSGIKESMLDKAVDDIKPDLIFAGRMALYKDLSKLWWGRGYVSELQHVYRMADDDFTDRERNLRIGLVKKNWERQTTLANDLKADWARLTAKVSEGGADAAYSDPSTLGLLGRFRVMNSGGHKPALAYVKELGGEEFRRGPKDGSVVIDAPLGRPLNSLDVQAIWGNGGVVMNEVNLDGFLPLRYYDRIAQNIEEQYANVMSQKDQYSSFQYYNHHDFKIILGLTYLVKLARAMGVTSKLEPVLSFGLGTNDVSAAEVSKIYQTFANGKTYRFYKEGPDNQMNFIRRIEDRDGKVLYEPEKKAFQLVDSCYAAQMGEILRKVVTHGTGRRLRGELYLDYDQAQAEGSKDPVKTTRIGVPAYGKTGTTNDYTTAYFAGYVPYPVKKNEPLDPMQHQYVIASYVGYDMNKSMRRGGFRISGAMGALPIWTDYAKGLVKDLNFRDFLDPTSPNMAGYQTWPTVNAPCSTPLAVDLPGGLVLQGSGDSDAVEFTNFDKEGETFHDEFARSASVRANVNVATVLSGGARTPRRAFQPFMKYDSDKNGPKLIEGKAGGEASSQGPAPVLPVMENDPNARGGLGEMAVPAASQRVGGTPVNPPGPTPVAAAGALGPEAPVSKGPEPEKKLDPAQKTEEDAGLQNDELW
ncbi:MAG: transglycosylase domain-containing protein [Oligoflexus sp.]|nr:transglycosylase domain-containing protein [Oligoflexus sp.]